MRFFPFAFLLLTVLTCGQNDPHNEQWWLAPQEIPEWAQVGKFNTARWDGGPIEAEKGRLSGWPHWEENDPENILTAVSSFYGLETVSWAKRAGLNWLWVTWSVGFSHETEQKQWDILKRYIKACHQNDIRVTAYISGANMFHEDMADFVPESVNWWMLDKNGKPIPYGAAKYSRYGVTRYMADTQHPNWLPYQRVRIRQALKAGVDGFWVDNIGSNKYEQSIYDLVDMIFDESKEFDTLPLVCFNMHRGSLALARYTNCLSTEDGFEPGYYTDTDDDNSANSVSFDAFEGDLNSGDGQLVCNIGILKYQWAVSEGWRPSSIEYGKRHNGVSRMVDVMAPEKWQLCLAECKMFHNSLEPYFEGIFMRDLVAGDSLAHACLDAMGQYNHFFTRHQDYFTHPKSIVPLAVIAPYEGGTIERELISDLNFLSSYNLQYDVLFNEDISKRSLQKYKVIVIPDGVDVTAKEKEVIAQWSQDGGICLLMGAPHKSWSDLYVQKSEGSLKKDGLQYFDPPLTMPDLVKELKPLLESIQTVTLEAPPFVLHYAVSQQESKRTIIHLLNYSQKTVYNVKIHINSQVSRGKIISPDFPKDHITEIKNHKGVFTIPRLDTYALIVVD
jgi:hypothetical protein